jgi:hypothetical protein
MSSNINEGVIFSRRTNNFAPEGATKTSYASARLFLATVKLIPSSSTMHMISRLLSISESIPHD